jgi:hypothetical protein
MTQEHPGMDDTKLLGVSQKILSKTVTVYRPGIPGGNPSLAGGYPVTYSSWRLLVFGTKAP